MREGIATYRGQSVNYPPTSHTFNNSIQVLLTVAVPLDKLRRLRMKDELRTIFGRVLCMYVHTCVYIPLNKEGSVHFSTLLFSTLVH